MDNDLLAKAARELRGFEREGGREVRQRKTRVKK